MKPILILGKAGRMSAVLQSVLTDAKRPFQVCDIQDLKTLVEPKNLLGVIDFTHPDVTSDVLSFCQRNNLPLVCGTTGWKSEPDILKIFEGASNSIPIVWDSNFSQGIEWMSQCAERLAPQVSALHILDIHHTAKKDAPSGTALKLSERARSASSGLSVSIDSVRFGSIPGEHRILISLPDETLEIVHRASSRKPFAEGAIRALDWLVSRSKKTGFFRMRNLSE